MRGRVATGLAAVLACALGGCASVVNTFGTAPGEGGQRVFGGVRTDLDMIRGSPGGDAAGGADPARSQARAAGVFFGYVDLPLSVVGDTLTLPLTTCAALSRLGDSQESADAARDKKSREVSDR